MLQLRDKEMDKVIGLLWESSLDTVNRLLEEHLGCFKHLETDR